MESILPPGSIAKRVTNYRAIMWPSHYRDDAVEATAFQTLSKYNLHRTGKGVRDSDHTLIILRLTNTEFISCFYFPEKVLGRCAIAIDTLCDM